MQLYSASLVEFLSNWPDVASILYIEWGVNEWQLNSCRPMDNIHLHFLYIVGTLLLIFVICLFTAVVMSALLHFTPHSMSIWQACPKHPDCYIRKEITGYRERVSECLSPCAKIGSQNGKSLQVKLGDLTGYRDWLLYSERCWMPNRTCHVELNFLTQNYIFSLEKSH